MSPIRPTIGRLSILPPIIRLRSRDEQEIPPTMLPYSTREEAGVLVVVFEDPAGFSGLRDLTRRDAIYALIPDRDNPCVVLNLEKADYLSSFGVATLIGLKRRIEERGGKLVLCSIHPVVRELLTMMNLEQIFTIADDEASALSSLRPMPTA